ncbi:hypothetical protein BH10ACT1_BH10ACT1_12120 [soil metagenome]
MSSPGRTLLTWLGRVFLLAIPYVLLCNLFFPTGIQFLDPVACPSGLSIETRGDELEAARSVTSSYALVCTSNTRLVDATDRLGGILALFFLLAVVAYVVRNRITPRALSAPSAPAHG